MRFAARQPIFRRDMSVYGYEILFRSGFEATANFRDSDQATFATLDNSILWGLDQLCGDKLAFVNCTRSVLIHRLIELLPPSRTVVEVLEDVLPEPAVLEACRALKEKGYLIALDDVQSLRELGPYLEFAEIIKVDFRLTTAAQQRDLAREIRSRGLLALAEKVEDGTEHRLALEMGYQLFQGFFFCKPEIVQRKDIHTLYANRSRVLQAIQQRELDRTLITDLIHADPSLNLRLLRYLNSYSFALQFEVTSIRHALDLLGEDNVRKWLLVTAVIENCSHKPSELVLWALVRARFCELIGEAIGDSLAGGFWLGMISAFPALLDVPLATVLEHMPVPQDVKQALCGEAGVYREMLDLLTCYEAGDWQNGTRCAHRIGVSEATASAFYVKSMEWARLITSDTSEAAAEAAPAERFASYRPNDMVAPSPEPLVAGQPVLPRR